MKPLAALAVFGAFITAAGALLDPASTWPAILLCGFYAAGVGLGGALFLAVHDVSGAKWIEPLRPTAMRLTKLVPLGCALLLAARFFGAATLYPAVHGDGFKAVWLATTFAGARAIAYPVIWIAAVRWLRGAAYIVVFAVTVCLASVDFIMALEPQWASTMFGVYHFAGLFAAAIAAIIVLSRNAAMRDGVRHDLGKLLFGFSTFWMYIWFSQYMLIWYGNIPEEARYFTLRTGGGWGVLMIANVVVNWIAPFIALMSQRAKKNATVLTRVAIAVLAGHAIDLFLSIAPAHAASPSLGAWAVAAMLGTLAASVLVLQQRGQRAGEALVLVEPVVEHR